MRLQVIAQGRGLLATLLQAIICALLAAASYRAVVTEETGYGESRMCRIGNFIVKGRQLPLAAVSQRRAVMGEAGYGEQWMCQIGDFTVKGE